jgi:hypothetical protein
MIRALVISAAICGAAVGAGAAAGAEPPPPEPRHFDDDVPGMAYDAELGDACFSWERFTYGRAPGGEALTCHYIPNQFPRKDSGFWVISYPLYGVQEIGSPCPGSQAAAQAPDGRALLCLGAQGWQPGIFTGGAGPYAPPGVQQPGVPGGEERIPQFPQ